MKLLFSLLITTMTVAPLLGKEPQSPEALIRSIYENHQPWNKKEIDLRKGASLKKYFDDYLVNLFIKNAKCEKRTREICNLSFDPILYAQDYDNAPQMNLALKEVTTKLNERTFEVTFTNLSTRTLVFLLRRMPQGWRVNDIIYSEGHSLKKILE